jgi:hypothetical protein
MSKIALSGNASGTGTFTIASPNSNSDRTLNLPDSTTTLVGTDATQTLTNKTINGGAITQATAVTASGTSVDFTSIPSWVKRITVMFSGVSTNGSSNLLMQIGDGSVVTTGYLSGASTFNDINAGSTAGFLLGAGNLVAASAISGSVVLTNISTSAWVSSGNVNNTTNTPANGASNLSGGNKTLSGTLDRVRITTVNGTDTFDAGTINILYE